jgi:hypothetical protein
MFSSSLMPVTALRDEALCNGEGATDINEGGGGVGIKRIGQETAGSQPGAGDAIEIPRSSEIP